jgi:tRNA(Ile)-lysidine synthase
LSLRTQRSNLVEQDRNRFLAALFAMTSVDESPLTDDEFAALMAAVGGFEARPMVAVGISGGPDSMALTLLADRWARRRGGQAWGLTVDHGLRPESAAEARTVACWLAARGIPHEILPWVGGKPASGIQEAARDARYRLLGEWCRAHFCLHLLTAHHREDQAETYLIRRRAGSGPDGLAAMSAVRELPHCRLVRPLLSVPRARLAALLAAEGQPFLRDPSNLNPAFERAGLRLGRVLRADMITETRAYGGRRVAREAALDRLLAGVVALHPAGFAVLDAAALGAVDPETAERLLDRVAACIGAGGYPARRARLGRLREGLSAQPERGRTLGGCRFVPWRGRILVLRELAAAEVPVRLDRPVWLGLKAALLWDRRFAVAPVPAMARGLTLGYLGQRDAGAPAGSGGGLPPLTHAVLPAFWDERGLASIPHLGYRRAGVGALPELLFRPINGLTRAGFTVV